MMFFVEQVDPLLAGFATGALQSYCFTIRPPCDTMLGGRMPLDRMAVA